MTDTGSLALFWHKAGLGFTDRRPRRSRKISWVDFLRPAHGHPFLNVTIEEAFGIFQWMVRTGSKYPGVLECLSEKGSCINFCEVDSFTTCWIGQLQRRFACALLDPFVRDGVYEWREAERIQVGKTRVVVFPHAVGGGPDSSDDSMRIRIDALFGVRGRVLSKSHNRFHLDARTVFRVALDVLSNKFVLRLVYGYAEDAAWGSSWTISIEHAGPFDEFVGVCEARLRELLLPDRATRDPAMPVWGEPMRLWTHGNEHCGDGAPPTPALTQAPRRSAMSGLQVSELVERWSVDADAMSDGDREALLDVVRDEFVVAEMVDVVAHDWQSDREHVRHVADALGLTAHLAALLCDEAGCLGA